MNKTNKLEAQAIAEATGNYDEADIEEIMNIYEKVIKHVGFEDNRRDKRYIVKFHDIFYCMPEENSNAYTDRYEMVFNNFCYDMQDQLNETWRENNININLLLSNSFTGHYQAFMVDIPEITDENAIEIAMRVYDEGYNYTYQDYVSDYVFVVNTLQDLEDNYMEYWIDYLEANEYFTEEDIKKIKEKYESIKERRK